MYYDDIFTYFDEKGEKVKIKEKGWLGQTLCKHEFRKLTEKGPFASEIVEICPKCGTLKSVILKK